jgi:hypothetical protein
MTQITLAGRVVDGHREGLLRVAPTEIAIPWVAVDRAKIFHTLMEDA